MSAYKVGLMPMPTGVARAGRVAGWSAASAAPLSSLQPVAACFRRGASARASSRAHLSTRAEATKLPSSVTQVAPTGDNVFIKVAEAEEKTTGGIYLPTESVKRPTSGDVVAVGDGGSQKKEMTLKEGNTVLYSKFGIGCTDIDMGEDSYIIMKEDDIMGVFPSSGATAADVPQLQPIGDRVMIKIDAADSETAGGVLLPEEAKEKPVAGQVVAIGPGKEDKPVTVANGDRVIFFKYAGDKMSTPEGDEYVVLHSCDILCKL